VCNVHFSIWELDDGGRDGGEGAFEGGDEVCFAGDVAECICGVGDAEIYSVELVLWSRLWRKKGGTIHLIVHYHPGFRNHDLASKQRVHSACDCDGKSTLISCYVPLSVRISYSEGSYDEVFRVWNSSIFALISSAVFSAYISR
jgi:hypothetical protein